MDPVSHVVFAQCLVRAVARRESTAPVDAPLRGAGLAISLGALSPDIDLVLMPTGWDRYLAAHEVGTHSLFGAIVCGALAAGLAALIRRRTRYRSLVRLSVVAAISHVVADLLSGASIKIGWPFEATRVSSLGVVAMAEPLFVVTSVLGGILMWAAAPRSRRALRSIAVGLLLAFATLVIAQTVLRERAETAYERAVGTRDRVAAYVTEPVWGSFSDWRIFDRTDQDVRAWTVTPGGRIDLAMKVARHTGDRSAIAASAEWDTVRNFVGAHEYAFAVASPQGVEWSDVRYCSGTASDGLPICGVWAGGEFSTPPALGRLVVRVGDLVQVR